MWAQLTWVQIVIGMSLLAAPLAIVGSLAIGAFGYSPEKAQGIRDGEAEAPVIIEEIRRIHIRHPEKFKHDRLDRHWFYLGIHVAVWCYAWCIFAGAPVTNNLASLSPGTKTTMATCFIIGSTLVLSGSAMGARIGRWTLLQGIRNNMTSSALADDIRLPYTFGAAGMFAMATSMFIYARTSFGSTVGSLGGWLTALITIACIGMFFQMLRRIRSYDRARETLIAKAVTEIVDRGHVAD